MMKSTSKFKSVLVLTNVFILILFFNNCSEQHWSVVSEVKNTASNMNFNSNIPDTALDNTSNLSRSTENQIDNNPSLPKNQSTPIETVRNPSPSFTFLNNGKPFIKFEKKVSNENSLSHASDFFGSSLAISEDKTKVAVGVQFFNSLQVNSKTPISSHFGEGMVNIYDLDKSGNLIFNSSIKNPLSLSNYSYDKRYFGSVVKMTNTHIAVTAQKSVSVFHIKNNKFEFLQEILPPQSIRNVMGGREVFGEQLAISGRYLAIYSAFQASLNEDVSYIYLYYLGDDGVYKLIDRASTEHPGNQSQGIQIYQDQLFIAFHQGGVRVYDLFNNKIVKSSFLTDPDKDKQRSHVSSFTIQKDKLIMSLDGYYVQGESLGLGVALFEKINNQWVFKHSAKIENSSSGLKKIYWLPDESFMICNALSTESRTMPYYLAIDQYRITNNQFTKSGSHTFNPLMGRSIHYLARNVLVTPNTIFFGSPDGKNSPDGSQVIEPAYLYQFKLNSSMDLD